MHLHYGAAADLGCVCLVCPTRLGKAAQALCLDQQPRAACAAFTKSLPLHDNSAAVMMKHTSAVQTPRLSSLPQRPRARPQMSNSLLCQRLGCGQALSVHAESIFKCCHQTCPPSSPSATAA